ncbi:MAG: 4Fe-4S binding protein [Truepera sp.]|nr:4Fe-4S binding protein [Truepera sp.]
MYIPIVFFSASNNTKYIAQLVAQGVEFEGLTPVHVPIEELANYSDIVEQAPLIAVGAPIHGGFAEPIYRWLRAYDFTGKQVYLFSTAAFLFFGSSVEAARIVTKNGGNVAGILEVRFQAPGDGIYLLNRMRERYPLPTEALKRAFELGRTMAVAASSAVSTEHKQIYFSHRKRLAALSSLWVVKLIKRAALFIAKRCLFRFDPKKCTACGACEKTCPSGAVHAKSKQSSAKIPISLGLCIVCLRCFKACPTAALYLIGKERSAYYQGPWQLHGYLDPAEAKTRFGRSKRDGAFCFTRQHCRMSHSSVPQRHHTKDEMPKA